MLYGEGGTRAFHRLEEEIMKYSTDQTILAWSPPKQDYTETMSVLADSPLAFHDGSQIEPVEEHEHFEMTSRGLRLSSRLYDASTMVSPDVPMPYGNTKVVLLSCVYACDHTGQLAIHNVPIEEDSERHKLHKRGTIYQRIM